MQKEFDWKSPNMVSSEWEHETVKLADERDN